MVLDLEYHVGHLPKQLGLDTNEAEHTLADELGWATSNNDVTISSYALKKQSSIYSETKYDR